MALKKSTKIVITILIIAAILALFYTFFVQVRRVNAGEIGVKASLGSPVDNNADFKIEAVKGYVVFMPLYSDVAIYPTSIQVALYDSIRILSNDAVYLHIRPSVSFQLDESKVIQFYKATRSSQPLSDGSYLKELVTSSYITAAATFTADSIANNENEFEELANKILSVKLNEIGIILKNTVSNIDYPESVRYAIDLRAKAVQEALIVESRLRQVEALRKEDSLRYSALTPLAIQKMFIDKWDGKMSGNKGEVSRIYDSISGNTN